MEEATKTALNAPKIASPTLFIRLHAVCFMFRLIWQLMYQVAWKIDVECKGGVPVSFSGGCLYSNQLPSQ